MALRQLSVLYLAAASSFAVAATLASHPVLNSAVHTGANFTAVQAENAAVALDTYVIQPGWSFARVESASLYRQAWNAMYPPVQVARVVPKTKTIAVAKAKPKPSPVEIDLARVQARAKAMAALQNPSVTPPSVAPNASAPPAPVVRTSPPAVTASADREVASLPASPPKLTLAPQVTAPAAVTPSPFGSAPPSAVPADHPPSPAELVRVTQHLRDSLTAEMLANFDLFLFVSKAQGTSVAQRMYVFQKQTSGDLVMLYNWPVSTGREQIEFAPNGTKQPSFTPAGYYELDPKRMYVHHFSGQWKQPMPYAMFFNWQNHGYQTGLAIHSATGDDIGLLGTRASAGCVRLSPENARLLFSLIKNNYKGLMPKFAYDKRTASMSNQGVLVHDVNGRIETTDGYKVLVFIENYNGENVVAALF